MRANVNVPIDQLTDFQMQGEILDASGETTFAGTPTRISANREIIGVGIQRRSGDNSVVNPYFGGSLAYQRLRGQMEPSSEYGDFQMSSFLWNLDLGCEVSASEKMSIRLGLRTGKGFGFSNNQGLPIIPEWQTGIRLSSAVWLTDNFFIDGGATLDFNDDVSLGAGGGFGF